MKKNVKRMISFILCVAVIFCYTSISVSAADTYTAVSGQPLTIADGDTATITLYNITIEAENGSAITLGENSNVTLILKGENTLKGASSTNSCGINVPESAKLTIEGDGILNVTGGKYGAGIGSYYEKVNGEIVINSGTIHAVGGDRGAGIGSGYHTSAGDITINGGNVTAIGSGCGAGIGNGYGTSGGGEGKVGLYNGGNITINGGKVRAASMNVDFDTINPYDSNTLTPYNSTSTFGAGIGGGYGSSSGNIAIKGGDVVAVGSCGGTGIGSGRGTSSSSKYDKSKFFVNVEISGNAKVVALAQDDCRKFDGGGAAIGSGRGAHTGGTIRIKDKANVTAIASPRASAIGSGSNKNPVDGSVPQTEEIEIGGDVTLYAVSDATRYAIDTTNGTKQFASISENVQQILFSQDVLNTDSDTNFDLIKNGETIKQITIPAKMKSVAVTVNKAGNYALVKEGYYGVQQDESTQYPVSNTLSEQTCVKLVKPEESEGVALSNEFAYIFGKNDVVMEPSADITREEASALLYRLLKQNNLLGDFVYNKDAKPLFEDIENRWSRSALEYMTSIGVYSTGEQYIFADAPITRQEAFRMFCLSLKFTTNTQLIYSDYAKILQNKGYIQGDENGDLNLKDKITRAEFCTVYNKITGRDKMPLTDISGKTINAQTYGFTDISEDEWYYDVVLKATSAYSDGFVDISKRGQRNNLDDYE